MNRISALNDFLRASSLTNPRKCPECANKIVVWNIDDPYFLPPKYAEAIFKKIRERVVELANSLWDRNSGCITP